MGDQVREFLPDIVRSARADRAFLKRAIRFLVTVPRTSAVRLPTVPARADAPPAAGAPGALSGGSAADAAARLDRCGCTRR